MFFGKCLLGFVFDESGNEEWLTFDDKEPSMYVYQEGSHDQIIILKES